MRVIVKMFTSRNVYQEKYFKKIFSIVKDLFLQRITIAKDLLFLFSIAVCSIHSDIFFLRDIKFFIRLNNISSSRIISFRIFNFSIHAKYLNVAMQKPKFPLISRSNTLLRRGEKIFKSVLMYKKVWISFRNCD